MNKATQLLLFICLFPLIIQAQIKYLHCGQLIDCTDQSVKKEMTIIVDGNTVSRI
jgi:hypothetical protein